MLLLYRGTRRLIFTPSPSLPITLYGLSEMMSCEEKTYLPITGVLSVSREGVASSSTNWLALATPIVAPPPATDFFHITSGSGLVEHYKFGRSHLHLPLYP